MIRRRAPRSDQTDWMTEANAETLAERIRAYWGRAGLGDVDTFLRKRGYNYCVRSDMINGRPRSMT